jgi:hypothetical protein
LLSKKTTASVMTVEYTARRVHDVDEVVLEDFSADNAS